MAEALFDLPTSYAHLSEDGVYRYTLGRRWSQDLDTGAAVFVMLNPSTADAMVDDPTIRRCIGFAKALGCGGLHVVNLYAWRTKSPAALFEAEAVNSHDIIGPENDDILRATFAAAAAEGRPVIAGWGAHGTGRAEFVDVLARAAGAQLTALGVTKDGQPRHPLYLPASARPERWPA